MLRTTQRWPKAVASMASGTVSPPHQASTQRSNQTKHPSTSSVVAQGARRSAPSVGPFAQPLPGSMAGAPDGSSAASTAFWQACRPRRCAAPTAPAPSAAPDAGAAAGAPDRARLVAWGGNGHGTPPARRVIQHPYRARLRQRGRPRSSWPTPGKTPLPTPLSPPGGRLGRGEGS